MGTGNQFVLEGIVMNIIHVIGHIVAVFDKVFPEPSLPDAAPPFPFLGVGNFGFLESGGPIALGEMSLNHAPARGKITVAVRHLPDTVQMVRQENHR